MDEQNCINDNKTINSEKLSPDPITEFRGQSHSIPELTPEVVISLLAQKPWTEGELRDEVVRIGHSRESFDTIFHSVKQDPRVEIKGVTPVYYSLKADG